MMSPDIFRYTNYRLFLEDYIRVHYLEKGKIYRALAKTCTISSPNYFQQVFKLQKNMSPQTAEKIAEALGFSKSLAQYFVGLVRLDSTKDADKRFAILGELKTMAARRKKKTLKNSSLHSNWVHQVIWSLAHTKGFVADPLSIQESMHGSLPLDEIEGSLHFLKANAYLVFDEAEVRYRPQSLHLETDDDIRNLDLQRNHNRFLQMAQLRLNDPLLEREFQGLTVAIPRSRWPLVKEKMRAFIREMNETLDEPQDYDAVIRLQMAAFTVASTPKGFP